MTTEKFSWLRIAAWSLLLLVCLLFYSQAEAQNPRFDGIVLNRSGLPSPGAQVAVLNQIAITAASEATNTVTITSSLNPAQGATVTITGVSPAGYNGSYTVLTTSPTQFTYTNPASGLGAGTVFGSVAVTSPTPGSPLATLCANSTDTVCASPNPVTADGLGNYSFYIKGGSSGFTLEFFGSGLTPRIQSDQQGALSGIFAGPLNLAAIADPSPSLGLFWLSATTPGFLKWSDASAIHTVVGADSTQTLTNKALTRPKVGGTAISAGNVVLSAGWGSTATLSLAGGGTSRDIVGSLLVTAGGSGIAANPTITITLPDGTLGEVPIVLAQIVGATATVDLVPILSDGSSATQIVLVYSGTMTTAHTVRINYLAILP